MTTSHPAPVYVLGDSNVCTLADRVYRAPSGRDYLFRALYVPGLRARDFAGPKGALGARVSAALEAERLLVGHGAVLQAAHATTSEHWLWVRDLEARPRVAPPLVIAAGVIDLHHVSVGITEPDIALPGELLADPGTPAVCRVTAPDALGAAEAMRRYLAVLEPLRTGLRQLRALGFTRLAIMGHAPVSLDEAYVDRATERAGFPTIPRPAPTAFRYKGLLLCNAAAARICREENAAFVDRWGDNVGDDGLVKPGVLYDFIHLSDDATERSAAAIVAEVAERGRARVPSVRDEASEPDARRVLSSRGDGAIFRTTLADPQLATVHALAAARAADRILDVGFGRSVLAYAAATEGAHVTAVAYGADPDAAGPAYDDARVRFVRGDTGPFDESAYDVAVATGLENLEPGERARLLRDIAAAVRPPGLLVVHPMRNAWANGARADAPASVRPNRLRRELGAAFAHVLVWLGDVGDARGSLARRFTAAHARNASDVFAVASHAPLDVAALLARITTDPIDSDDTQIRISDAYAPLRVVRGQRFFAELTLENGSDATLSSFAPNPVRFAAVWLDGRDRQVAGDRDRTPIAPAARPHESARYGLEVTAPPEPGPYTLRLSVVQEFVRWYSTAADVAVAVL